MPNQTVAMLTSSALANLDAAVAKVKSDAGQAVRDANAATQTLTSTRDELDRRLASTQEAVWVVSDNQPDYVEIVQTQRVSLTAVDFKLPSTGITLPVVEVEIL